MRTVALTVVLAGCSGSGWEGIWLLAIPYVDEEDACVTSVVENYADADVPEEEDPVGPWTYESTFETSDTLLVIEILAARGNNVLLVLFDQVYPGTIEGGVLKVSWTDRTVSTYSELHEAGYSYTMDDTTETVETITLERNGEVDGASGKFDITTTTALAWRESDEWQVGQTYVYGTQIPAFLYLEGAGANNQPNQPDCAGGECSLEVSVDCALGAQVTALYVGNDDEEYAAIENAGQ